MIKQTIELQAVVDRLERVERENCRLKRIGLVLLLIPTALLVMGQARQPRTVEAEQFVLRDPQARQRATLEMWAGSAALRLFDNDGRMRAMLGVTSKGDAGLSLFDAAGNNTANLASLGVSSSLALSTGAEKRLPMMDAIRQPGITLHTGREGVGLELGDSTGYSAALGSTQLLTPNSGETHQTSAASLVLFGKDKKVIWSAP